VAGLAAPASVAVASPPAVDQYTQHLPTAGGATGATGGTAPVARLQLLPSKTRAALTGPDGERLAQIATAPTLGAPASESASAPGGQARPGGVGGARHGYATVVADTAGTGATLALIGALAVIVVPGAWTRFMQRRQPSDRSL
jgi:hypothetical protein